MFHFFVLLVTVVTFYANWQRFEEVGIWKGTVANCINKGGSVVVLVCLKCFAVDSAIESSTMPVPALYHDIRHVLYSVFCIFKILFTSDLDLARSYTVAS